MDLTESFAIDAPMISVWPLLQDVGVVADCLPGVELKDQEGDTYLGTITVKFGPTTVAFSGRAEISYRSDSETVSINARGQDSRGASRASAEVLVRARPAGSSTVLDIAGDVEVHGQLAAFASTGGIFVTKQLLKEFAASLANRARPQPMPIGQAAGAADPIMTATRETTKTHTVNGFHLLWQAFVMWASERLRRRRP